ncbi:HD-GYP domain-containing protein [Athalassotoga saccharophila]|uniref:HD-GYP domain-containing protein n=1 Tax=Athalassotoga saccharophila TaxID=1441386 RepID=UPI00137AA9A1|nr:HD domain-containing phosphohydrolase [Athalassotoga saccharophila]
MNYKIKIYVDNIDFDKSTIEDSVEIVDLQNASVILSDHIVNDSRPVCVMKDGAFDIHYEGRVSHIESDDVFLAIGTAISLVDNFENSFIYKNRFRILFVRMLESFIINGEVEDMNGMSHSERVAKLAKKFGEYLGINGEDLDKLVEYAMLHDVGKIGLEQILLFSPTRIRNWLHTGRDHTVVGSIFLATTGILMDAAPVARSHHERWDGKGYPDKLKGKEIPYYARIIGICDFFDEATNTVSSEISTRPLEKYEAVEMIKENSGIMFDPELTEKFVRMMEMEV